MLESANLNDKTYEELLEEAIAQIPLYGGEWTNFNVSDPGVTVLQNLTSFNYLQQTLINTVTDAVKYKLLALLGFLPRKARPAEALVALVGENALRLCRYRKFLSHDMVFEAGADEFCRMWGMEAVYCVRDGVYSDATSLLDRTLGMSAPVFGAPPRDGAGLCCILGGKPDFSKEFPLYAEVVGEERRNAFSAGADEPFAEIVWQLYTEKGWADIPAIDGSRGFLTSGEIRLGPSELEAAVFSGAPVPGYALRCLLVSHEYDMPPRLRTLNCNLTRLIQRDTKAAMYRLRGGRAVFIEIDAIYPYVSVFGRENGDAPYRAYRSLSAGETAEGGRVYKADRLFSDAVRFSFEQTAPELRPGEGEDDLILICCTEEMERARALGPVFGYADQEMEIDLEGDVVPDDFVLMLETGSDDGGKVYEWLRPGEVSPDGFLYEMTPEKNMIRVRRPEIGRDCAAWVASCAVTLGAEGNIRGGNSFTALVPEGAPPPARAAFVNVAPGRGGETPETLAELRARFSSRMKTPWAAVTASDYEALVMSAPGLCIHKVKAMPDPGENIVRIVVKPFSEERFPRLPESYIKRINSLLASRRMLSTAFKLVQPEYIPVSVKGAVYVKSRFANAREVIERAFRDALDFVSSGAEFGTPVLFNKVFGLISDLPCVLTIVDLSLTPGNRGAVVTEGLDIIPGGHCLCYPGDISLEISTRPEH